MYEFPTLCRNAAGMVPTVYCTAAAVVLSSEVTVNTTVLVCLISDMIPYYGHVDGYEKNDERARVESSCLDRCGG